MSRLSEMIKELCPDGVEYRKLEDVLKICNGSDYKKFGKGDIPVYGSGGVMTYIDTYVYDKPSVLIPRKGSLDKLYYIDVPFWTVDTIFYTKILEEVLPKYVFYYLQSQHLERLNKAGGVPSLTQSILNKVIIPVPPLAIQNEIVKLLDNFTELTAELTAELQLRKKQYSFYRDSLLNFSRDDVDVEWRTLGETCDTLSGFPFDSSQFTSSGIRLMRGMNVKRGVLDFREENNRYWKGYDGLEKYLLESDDIIIAMDGSLVGQSYGLVKEEQRPLLLVQRVARVRSRKANPHYIYHYISSGRFTDYVNLKRTAGAVPHISLRDIEHFKIPFPSTEKQNQIAAILDQFDALCHDLTQGLPAEIAARKKQYEYYRDKLLTFPRKGA